jgi:multimeric flavodoxin WrbA
MKTLLVVFHSPSHNTSLMSDAVAQAAKQHEGVDLKIKIKTPFETDAEDVLHCDAIILGTTENLGYMSGALKDFFDRIYYPCLDVKQGLPVAAIIRAGHDGTGTQRALETILTGLRWRWVQSPLLCKGKWDVKFLTECAELSEGMTLALEQGII